MAQISPLGRRSGCRIRAAVRAGQVVLLKRGNSAKIHPGLGFIWGILVKPTFGSPGRMPFDFMQPPPRLRLGAN